MHLNDFNYFLPKDLIAQKAAFPKDSSRLMVLKGNQIEHKYFFDIINYLKKDDILVLNNTKVRKAKIRGMKTTGSRAEMILCKKLSDKEFTCRIKGNRLKVGNRYIFQKNLNCEIISRDGDIFTVRFDKDIDKDIINKNFELPLPPYVKRNIQNEQEYQTVYSEKEGSLAAPTAGLHFTEGLLETIRKKGVKIANICLHIDFGTFLPVKGNIEAHKMHEEYFEISKETADMINNRKGRLICVGTTSVRALESANEDEKILQTKAKTDIFIYPGYNFKNSIDALITNFHLPKSTLLMLVSAFFGREKILHSYNIAIRKKYRFYSLGDAMMLIKN